jgi:hypothetical protein
MERRRQYRMYPRMAGLLLTGLLLVGQAEATIRSGGGSRIIGTDFIVELVTVMTNVWVPFILIATLVGVLGGLSLGYIRMSGGMSKLVIIVLLGGVGISGLLSMLGLDSAVALLG